MIRGLRRAFAWALPTADGLLALVSFVLIAGAASVFMGAGAHVIYDLFRLGWWLIP